MKDDVPIPDFVDKSRDIVIEYPEQAVHGSGRGRHFVPDPEGISGGGLWIYNPNSDSGVFGSHNARFIGIQKSWFKSQRIAIGNRIIVWLRLLARDYPDLRQAVNEKIGPVIEER